MRQERIVLSFVLLIAALVAVFSFGSDPRVIATAQIAASGGTLVLACLAYSQLRELRETRIGQERPQVIVDAEYKGQLVYLTIRNIGKGAARNIDFEFSESLKTTDRANISQVDSLPCFADGIDYLAPEAKISVLWDSMITLTPALEEKQFQGVTITSRYKSLSEDRLYETRWTINPLMMVGTSVTPQSSLNDLVKVIREIRKDIQKLYRRLNRGN